MPTTTSVAVPQVYFSLPANLKGGTYTLSISLNGVTGNSVPITVFNPGLYTSQTGLTFKAPLEGQPVPQTFLVLSDVNDSSWTLSVSTISGGGWLSATPISGTSNGGMGVPVQVSVSPENLDPGAYYGVITITLADPEASTLSLTVVLSIDANAQVSLWTRQAS